MQKIVTATGREIDVEWCGPSTIDMALRFGVPNGNMAELIQTFTNPEETETLTHYFDEHETVFTGYTVFKGIDLKVDGEIVVALNHE